MLLAPCSAACVWELIFCLFHFACVGWGGLGWGMLMFTCSCQCYVRHGSGLKRVLVGAGEENYPPEEDVKKMRCECWQCRQSMMCLPVVVKSLVLVVVHSRVLSWFGNLVLVVVKTYSHICWLTMAIPHHNQPMNWVRKKRNREITVFIP